MIYRKPAPQPPRLLLRVVSAGAGAALLLGCSGDKLVCGGTGFCADYPNDASDGAAGDDAADTEFADAVVGVAPCGDGGCGVMPLSDAGDGGDAADAADGGDAGDAGYTGDADAGWMGAIDSGGD